MMPLDLRWQPPAVSMTFKIDNSESFRLLSGEKARKVSAQEGIVKRLFESAARFWPSGTLGVTLKIQSAH